MIWNINCRRVRRLLALRAGNDLEQRECHVAERHLAVCADCREVWDRLQQSQQVLERARPASFEEGEGGAASAWLPVSVWPSVVRHIHLMDEQVLPSSWRDWLPAGAVTAACVGIITVTLSEVPVGESVSPSVISSSPATFDPNPRHLGPFPLGLHRAGDHGRVERAVNLDGANPDDNDPPRF